MSREETVKECLDRTAEELAERGVFTREDARSAVYRSYQFFKDTGYKEQGACDKALEMVGMASEAANRLGFQLRPMVDHMLYSIFHRTRSGMF